MTEIEGLKKQVIDCIEQAYIKGYKKALSEMINKTYAMKEELNENANSGKENSNADSD